MSLHSNDFPGGRVRVAAAHIASVMLDPEQSLLKACQWIERAADQSVELIVFPESYLPGFPLWNALLRPIDGHAMFQRFAAASVRIDGTEIARLRDVAKRCRIHVSVGFSERSEHSPGCLWNANVLIGSDGSLLNHHRKLVPTFYEKLSWNRGDAAGLRVCATQLGRIGSLICGENGNPLSRYVLMAQGEQLHTANYPPVWPFTDPGEGEGFSLQDAIRLRAAAQAFEGKCFVIVSAGFLDEASIAVISQGDAQADALLRACPRSASMVVGPSGQPVGQVLEQEEGLVVADVDLDSLVPLRQHHDMAGYYNRMDLIEVHVDDRRPEPLYSRASQARAVSASERVTEGGDPQIAAADTLPGGFRPAS